MSVENPFLFGAVLERTIERASVEVAGLERIFLESGVPRNGLVLDLLWHGRHSVVLAEKGFRVIGVDISPEFITQVEKLAAEKNVSGNVEFKV